LVRTSGRLRRRRRRATKASEARKLNKATTEKPPARPADDGAGRNQNIVKAGAAGTTTVYYTHIIAALTDGKENMGRERERARALCQPDVWFLTMT
jgi:hypothetical protein